MPRTVAELPWRFWCATGWQVLTESITWPLEVRGRGSRVATNPQSRVRRTAPWEKAWGDGGGAEHLGTWVQLGCHPGMSGLKVSCPRTLKRKRSEICFLYPLELALSPCLRLSQSLSNPQCSVTPGFRWISSSRGDGSDQLPCLSGKMQNRPHIVPEISHFKEDCHGRTPRRIKALLVIFWASECIKYMGHRLGYADVGGGWGEHSSNSSHLVISLYSCRASLPATQCSSQQLF